VTRIAWFFTVLALVIATAGLAQVADLQQGKALTTQDVLDVLRTFESGDDDTYAKLLDNLVQQSLATPGMRHTMARALIDFLRSEALAAAKGIAADQLARLAGPDLVPALTGLLFDPETVDLACGLLEEIDHASVEDALRRALEKAPPEAQVRLIAALGERRSERVLGDLGRLARSEDHTVAEAALLAMGQIGSLRAVRSLTFLGGRLPKELQVTRQKALLQAAAHLMEAGETRQAAAIYDDIGPNAKDEEIRLGVFLGRVTLNDPGLPPELLDALEGKDEALREAARGYLLGLADMYTAMANRQAP
jgi:hypothetical protein